MNKINLSLFLALLISPNLYAVEGVITFNGTIESVTCSSSIIGGGTNATANANTTVTLPTINTTALASAQATAGKTEFSIVLTDGNNGPCSLNGLAAKPYFVYESNKVETDGRLKNSTEATTKVRIELLNNQSTQINVTQGASQLLSTSVDDKTYTYFARYYALDTAAAGTVDGSVSYNIIYQ